MRKIFDIEGSLNMFLTTIYQIMVINILTVIFSLPILTMGSAISTGYQLLYEQDTQPVNLRRFITCFKANLKMGVTLSVIQLITAWILVQCVILTMGTPLQFLSLLVLSFVAIVFMNTLLVTSRFKYKLLDCLKFSLILAMKYTGYFCLSVAVWLLSYLIPIFLPKLMFVWFFLGIGLPMLLHVKVFNYCLFRFQNIIEKGAVN